MHISQLLNSINGYYRIYLKNVLLVLAVFVPINIIGFLIFFISYTFFF